MMNDDILDAAEKEEIDNRPFINRMIQISIGTVFLFYLVERINVYLPWWRKGISLVFGYAICIRLIYAIDLLFFA